jgi:hypothetical protein
MLLAEYRELPRIHNLAEIRKNKYSNFGPRPERFTLNKGHVSYLLPFGETLKQRWIMLCQEMKMRGFTVNLQWRFYPWMSTISLNEQINARNLLIERIQNRLKTMKRKPTWTNRNSPEWVCYQY